MRIQRLVVVEGKGGMSGNVTINGTAPSEVIAFDAVPSARNLLRVLTHRSAAGISSTPSPDASHTCGWCSDTRASSLKEVVLSDSILVVPGSLPLGADETTSASAISRCRGYLHHPTPTPTLLLQPIIRPNGSNHQISSSHSNVRQLEISRPLAQCPSMAPGPRHWTQRWTPTTKLYTLFGQHFAMPSAATTTPRKRPLVLLFDIGGVCVVSPFQAILDYERAHSLPLGYINWTISQTSPNGAWQKLERGEIPLNHVFYDEWARDLSDEKRWRVYWAQDRAKQQGEKRSDGAEEAAYQCPPPPQIDTESLHNTMMSIARELDPYMGPALKKLRAIADKSKGEIVLAALSNTCIYPPGHKLYSAQTADGKASHKLGDLFDVFISSAHVGMRKPDEEIYRYALVRLREYVRTKEWADDVKPEDIIFLDDIGGNLRTGRRLGMRTIKVSLGRADLAVKELEKMTGLDLTSEKAKI